ncbi:hypothetical protein A3J43_01835 [Candidatus Uhrbacteria bacterium RIFCSPHIGHO2_12_FULL_54_23]|uniref:Uncharacterized protein n=2 Tax=Candidatus Uhriibacteriota TaxID=1752732 RepID=A0A1F7UKB8_9BACT|nr:MAG: hypothetical protein A3J43_01835 [Candidatus Uhrbacteria bacterium RIFCSPHIGHO2_12_FULL_54_23]OGL90336.1 MAG: hypothetical protein A3J36_01670 [Candidatus Uhrbacteria bacterium RIFCSPLOWO2_02_FULL_54_37]
MDINLLTAQTPGRSRMKKALIAAGIFVLAGTALGAWQFFSRNPALLERILPQKDLFEGFERLVLTGAHAQDNFELTAVSSDSLGIDPATAFILTSKDDEVTTDKLKASIVLEPAIKFSLEKKADREWKLALAESLLPNALVKIALAAEVEGSAGEKAVRDYEWAFQVKDTFKRPRSGRNPRACPWRNEPLRSGQAKLVKFASATALAVGIYSPPYHPAPCRHWRAAQYRH